jgi:hypothetical protein
LLAFLAGCSAKPECDSFETRNAVLQIISNDHNNPLGNYAAQNSNVGADDSSRAKPEAEASANSERTRPMYRLGETIVTTSTSKDNRTLQCIGAISATVGDTKASKEVNFTMRQSADGKVSVS